MWSQRGFRNVALGVAAIILIVIYLRYPEETPEPIKISEILRDINQSPLPITKAYHNTLIVDYLQPEDFKETNVTTPAPQSKRAVLRASIIATEQEFSKKWASKTFLSNDACTPAQFMESFQPSFNCPHSLKSIATKDGNWVCGLELFTTEPKEQECVIYTFGGGNKEFANEWLTKTDCFVLMFEFDEKDKLTDSRPGSIKYESHPERKLGAADGANGFKNMRSVLKENDHGWLDVMVLNISGREFEVLDQILQDFEEVLPFAQLIVNFYIHPGVDNAKFSSLFENMVRRGMRPYKAEPVLDGCPSAVTVVQYSFLNLRGKHLLLVGK